MPRYEFSDGRSHKFWEVEVVGDSYTVTYGRIGTKGQTSTKSFADAATAQKKADAAAMSKVKKGYQLVDDAALEAEKAEAEQRLVEADRLQELGDPRGRLIALQQAMTTVSGKDRAELRKEQDKLLSEHADALLGPLTDAAKATCAKITWKNGYWEKLVVASSWDQEDLDTNELLGELLAHPSCAHLEELHVGIPFGVWDGESDWQASIDQIAGVGCPDLERLHLADDDDNAEISWCEIGDLSKLWKACPKLEALRIRGGGVTLGDIDAPNLTRLELVSGGLPAEPVQALSKASLPALEHLEVYFGTTDYGAGSTVEDVAGIFAGSGLPSVTWLGLKNGEIMEDVARGIVSAPILRQLKTLDLSMGTMTDEGGQVLLDNAERLAHLELLDLTENFLSADLCGRLNQALGAKVRLHSQKNAHEYGDDAWYYTSVSE